MELGIKGKKALVCASSKGLGFGCAQALAEAGVDLVMNARGSEALEASAEALRKFGVSVETVAADVTSAEGQAAVLKAAAGVDILVNNAGGPPPGLWSDWDRDDFIGAIDANMLTPITFMKNLLPGMMDKGWGRVVNITSQSVKAPIPQLGLSNAARAGLTGYVAGTARQVAGHGVTINNLPADPRRSRQVGTARQKNSVPPARFCVLSMPVSLWGKTCCWMVALLICPCRHLTWLKNFPLKISCSTRKLLGNWPANMHPAFPVLMRIVMYPTAYPDFLNAN